MEQLFDFIAGFGGGPLVYLLVFGILLACGLGLPIPEDITLVTAGLLSYYGEANVHRMFVISLFGVMAGDTIIFYLGSKYGRRLTKQAFFSKVVPPERVSVVQQKLHRYGNKLIFAARFMPGLRAPIFFTAGTLHVPFRKFFFWDGMAALLSVPAIIYSVFYFGDELDRVIRIIKKTQYGILIVIGIGVGVILLRWFLKRRKNKKS